MTRWPSGLRRNVKAVVFIGVGSNPTRVKTSPFLQPLRSIFLYSLTSSFDSAKNEQNRPGISWEMMLWSSPPVFNPHEGVSLFGNFKHYLQLFLICLRQLQTKSSRYFFWERNFVWLLSNVESHFCKFHIFVSSLDHRNDKIWRNKRSCIKDSTFEAKLWYKVCSLYALSIATRTNTTEHIILETWCVSTLTMQVWSSHIFQAYKIMFAFL